MESQPNMDSVTPIKYYPPNKIFDYEVDECLVSEAEKYVSKFTWNEGIVERYIGYILRLKLGIFLFKIKKTRIDVDEWIWVLVGDIPPAYLTTDSCKTPSEALDGYIGAMEDWIEVAISKKSLEGVIPVNVAPTVDNIKSLESRLKFLDLEVLPKVKLVELHAQSLS